MPNDWTDITAPSAAGELRCRRIDPGHPLTFFVCRDSDHACVFQFRGDFDVDHVGDVPEFKVIEVRWKALADGNAHKSELLLTLQEQESADIFQQLCTDLRVATQGLANGDDQAGLLRILNRLKRWQKLLAADRADGLRKNEIVGLHGELLLLRDLFVPRLTGRDVVAAWRDEEQDFSHENCLVEVKTQQAAADSRLQISSEEQLDNDSGSIMVCHQTIAPADRIHQDARSLNRLVREISDELLEGEEVGREAFLAKVRLRGWEPNKKKYEEDVYLLTRRTYFDVNDDFPRLVPSDLRPGVERVRYHVRLEACESFRVSEGTVIEKVFGK